MNGKATLREMVQFYQQSFTTISINMVLKNVVWSYQSRYVAAKEQISPGNKLIARCDAPIFT